MSTPIPTAPDAVPAADWPAVIEDLNGDLLTAVLLERSVLRVQLRAREARVVELDARVTELEDAVRQLTPPPAGGDG